MRNVSMGALAVLMVAAPATAHGPTRQKTTESVVVSVAPAVVWARIGNFQDMSWHPAIAKTAGQGANAANATRVLTLGNGATVAETLTKHDDAAMIYSYRITEVDVKVFPVSNYSSTISVKPEEGGQSRVEWAGAYYRGYPNNDPPAELNDVAASQAVTGLYRAGLDALKKALDTAQR